MVIRNWCSPIRARRPDWRTFPATWEWIRSSTGAQQRGLSPRLAGCPRGAADVTIGDFNGDKHLDIAFLNAVRQAKGVQVFWERCGVFSAALGNHRIGLPHALRSADLDRDGRTDIVIATSGGAQSLGLEDTRSGDRSKVILIYGNDKGLDRHRMPSLPASQPRDVAISDLNKDGILDIAVANSAGEASLIYWGMASGYSPDRRTELPTLAANGVSSADLNGDGYQDLVFAKRNDDATYDVPSYVYWGSSTGFAPIYGLSCRALARPVSAPVI